MSYGAIVDERICVLEFGIYQIVLSVEAITEISMRGQIFAG